MKLMLEILFSITLFTLIYFTFNILKEQNILKKILDSLDNKYQERKARRKDFRLKEGNTEKINLIQRLDLLIERSNLRNKIPLNSEVYIVGTLIIAILGFFTSKKISEVWIFNLIVFICVLLSSYLIIYIYSNAIYEKVDNNLILFINVLQNFSSTTEDIVTIFEKTIPYIKEPLKTYVQEFVNDAKINGNLKIAFESFQDKIENERFKNIIKNIEISSRHEANYDEVLIESRSILKGYFKHKEKKKAIKKNGNFEIGICLSMSFYMVRMITGILPNLLFDLQNSIMGNCIILYCVFVMLISILKFAKS